jgi:hypothetical protein
MKSMITVREDVAKISRTYLPISAAISFFMDACSHLPRMLLKKQEQKWLMICGRLFSRLGREGVAISIV